MSERLQWISHPTCDENNCRKFMDCFIGTFTLWPMNFTNHTFPVTGLGRGGGGGRGEVTHC